MTESQTSTAMKESIRDFIMEQFPLARQRDISNEDSLLDDGLIDSMGTLEVVMYLEEAFNILLEDEDLVMDNFASITTLAEFVEAKRS